MSKQQLTSIEEFNTIVESTPAFLLIKHSLTCPISANAFEEYEKFTEKSDFPTFYLYVQEARPLSNYIAETYGVKHESPQALVFADGNVKWHTSHWNITEKSLQEALEK